MNAACATTLCLTTALVAGSAVAAQDAATVGRAFADHCFNPRLTAQTAQANIGPSGARIDFYNLDPFTSAAPSPVTGRAQTIGTDRRCEVAFDGFDLQTAIKWVGLGLKQEGLADRKAKVPEGFARANGTAFIAAAQLNPNRIAVVQVGARDGASGTETFINVERLLPLDHIKQ
ncbi:succinyl-CoA synthetase subunit beta [uncultured Sulfitobacter sp.]|uniref:succinyl-CoA synthetase subunit beta n=1 Tax=uncultured Sulfitobacter sp. TaxID=191468 RepID=UPI00260881AA|nr:succinyl-CoA synthetase subunit beta [uncultured Sulfitobacter sp.]